MVPSSKSKEIVGARVVPPPTGARSAGKGVPSPASSESAQKFMVWPEDRRERIAVKAYELWQERGGRHGHDLEDWFEAEAIVTETRLNAQTPE
mgnify:FL=1